MATVQMSPLLVTGLWMLAVACVEASPASDTWTQTSLATKHLPQSDTRRYQNNNAVGLQYTVTNTQALQIERIAKLRNQKRQESRQEKSLPISDRRSDENEVFGAKSKRIGKVVIKLRNGKKLVVKKRRKLHNEFLKPTTQKPVLVTVKSRNVSKKKSKISSPRSRGQQPVSVSSRPNDIFSSGEDQGISVFSLGDPRQDPKILRQQQQQQQHSTTPPPINFVTTPSPAKHGFPAIIVTPRSEQGIRTSSQIFESNKVIETEDESEEKKMDDEFDYYDYYDEYDDVTSERSEEQFRSEPAPSPPRPRFSSSTFPPPEERFADIDQEDLNNFSSFPAGPSTPSMAQRPQVSLDQLRQELLQTQFSPGVKTQPPVTQGSRVTIGLKSSDDRGRGQFTVTHAVPTPTPSPSSLPASNSVFSQPLTRTGSKFGQRAPTPAPVSSNFPGRFTAQSPVPSAAPVTRPRFQTTFSPSVPSTPAPQIRSHQPSQVQAFQQQSNGNQRFQQISQNVILPEITRKPEVLGVQQQREKNVLSNFESNSVVAAGRGEQSRTLNIFDNKARVENNFDQTPQLLSNFSPKQSQVSEKITGVNPQFRGSKQQTFVSDEVKSGADNSRDFLFESLPSRFSSAVSSNQNAFFFGPPSQTINMRDGSYTIITVLS